MCKANSEFPEAQVETLLYIVQNIKLSFSIGFKRKQNILDLIGRGKWISVKIHDFSL